MVEQGSKCCIQERAENKVFSATIRVQSRRGLGLAQPQIVVGTFADIGKVQGTGSHPKYQHIIAEISGGST